jgi:hypothetical protein
VAAVQIAVIWDIALYATGLTNLNHPAEITALYSFPQLGEYFPYPSSVEVPVMLK